MRRILLTIVALVFAATLTVTPVWAETYTIDPVHSQIQFAVDHLMVFTVRGFFTDFAGTIEGDEAKKTLTAIKATIKTASVDTRIEKRDTHLRSADFFDVEKFPEMTFASKKFKLSGNDLTFTGDLTIRGITKEVVLTGRYLGKQVDPWDNTRAGYEGTTTINRKDFGLVWNQAIESGGVVVGDMVDITLEIQAIKGK